MSRDNIPRLDRLDVEEVRAKCAICSFELTYPEYLLLGNRCIFHAKSLKPLQNISKFRFILHALREFEVVRGKIALKERGFTEIVYMPCVPELKFELNEIGSPGLKT